MRLARRLAAVLTALTLASLPLTGASAQTTTNDLPLNVTVARLTPVAPHAGQILTLSGLINNTTDLEYDKLGVVLRLSSEPLLSRGDLLAVADSTEHLPFSDDAGSPETIVSVLPGGTVPYKLEVPIDELHLTTAGVYRIGVEVFHTVDGDRVYDGRVNTFLPWVPASANVAPLHVAWLWPLLSKPRLAPDGSFTDDGLGAEVSPQGRLGRLLNVAKQALGYRDPIPLTPVVDPETVQELTLMADPAHPYTVKPIGSSQPAIPGAYRTEAASFLAELRAVMAKTTSIATPYADPDIEAWTSAQASVLITQARSTGLADRLPGVAGGLLWPPDGAVSESTLDLLTVSGLVLGPKAYPLPPASTPGYTPSATASVTRPGGTVPAVVIDDGLTRLATKRVPGRRRSPVPPTVRGGDGRHRRRVGPVAAGPRHRTGPALEPHRHHRAQTGLRHRPAAVAAAAHGAAGPRAGSGRPGDRSRPAAGATRDAHLARQPGQRDRLGERRAGRLPVDPVPGRPVEAGRQHRAGRDRRGGRGLRRLVKPRREHRRGLRQRGGRGAHPPAKPLPGRVHGLPRPRQRRREDACCDQCSSGQAGAKGADHDQGHRGAGRQPGAGSRSGSSTSRTVRSR